MQPFTNKESFDYLIEKMDKYGSPYFEEETVTKVLNESYAEWLKDKVKMVEADEDARANLSVLTLKKTIPTLSSKKIPLSFSPALEYILSVSGTYTYECLGTSTKRERPIKPLLLDELSKSKDNPDLAPDDYFPGYVRYFDGTNVVIDIVSESTPSNVEIFYIKQPVLFDIVNRPNDRIEVGLGQQHEIIDIAIRKLSITDNNYQSANAITSEINSNG